MGLGTWDSTRNMHYGAGNGGTGATAGNMDHGTGQKTISPLGGCLSCRFIPLNLRLCIFVWLVITLPWRTMFWNDNGHGYELLQCEAHHARKTNVCMLLLFIPMPQLKTKVWIPFRMLGIHTLSSSFLSLLRSSLFSLGDVIIHSFWVQTLCTAKNGIFPFRKSLTFPVFSVIWSTLESVSEALTLGRHIIKATPMAMPQTKNTKLLFTIPRIPVIFSSVILSTLGSASEALTFFGGETHHQSNTNGDTTEKDDKRIHNLDGVNVCIVSRSKLLHLATPYTPHGIIIKGGVNNLPTWYAHPPPSIPQHTPKFSTPPACTSWIIPIIG